MEEDNLEVQKHQRRFAPKEFQSKARGKPEILKQDINHEIKCILYILLNIFMFCGLVSNNFGLLGKMSVYILKGGFGVFGYELPLILTSVNIYFLLDKQNKIEFPTFVFTSLNILFVLSVQLFGIDCGLFGKWGLSVVIALVGKTGAKLVLISLLIVFIILLLNISINEVFINCKILLKSNKNNFKASIENKEKILDDFLEEEKIFSDYVFPSLKLLSTNKNEITSKEFKILEMNGGKIKNILKSFSINVEIVDIKKSPTITKYELLPNSGVKTSKITSLSKDIARALQVKNVRIEETSKGKGTIGIEVPNDELTEVLLRDLIETKQFQNNKQKAIFVLGIDISGHSVIVDIYDMPHLLISGSTGSGKSVCINTLITSILYKATPDEVKLVLIDPKVVEMSRYNGIPHLLYPVVTEVKRGIAVLSNLVDEMEKRYRLFDKKGVSEIKDYNKVSTQKLATIIVIIDELNDFMMDSKNETEEYICRLTQKSRATGILMVVATQRPSVDVITGVIKSNIPSRIAFCVPSQTDSRTILDESGAEKLQGKGDMLFKPMGKDSIRIQGSLIKKDEIEKVVKHLKTQYSIKYDNEEFRGGVIEKLLNKTNTPPKKINKIEIETNNDYDLYENNKIVKEEKIQFISRFESTNNIVDIIDYIVKEGRASASMIQKEFGMGYMRASKIMAELEKEKIIPELVDKKCNKPREVLLTMEEWHNIKFK